MGRMTRLMEEGKENAAIRMIPADKLTPSEKNFYGMRDIEELAASIRANGLEQNLVVVENGNGTYRIVTGNRRWTANQWNREHGGGMEELPCLVRPAEGDAREMIRLIATNQYRELTDWEKMLEVEKAGKAVRKLAEEGVKELGGLQLEGMTTRQMVSRVTGMSEGTVAKYAAIGKNLGKTGRTFLQSGKLPFTVAYEVCRMTEEWQNRLFCDTGDRNIEKKDVRDAMERYSVEEALRTSVGHLVDRTAGVQENTEHIENTQCRCRAGRCGPKECGVYFMPGEVLLDASDSLGIDCPSVKLTTMRFVKLALEKPELCTGKWKAEKKPEIACECRETEGRLGGWVRGRDPEEEDIIRAGSNMAVLAVNMGNGTLYYRIAWWTDFGWSMIQGVYVKMQKPVVSWMLLPPLEEKP